MNTSVTDDMTPPPAHDLPIDPPNEPDSLDDNTLEARLRNAIANIPRLPALCCKNTITELVWPVSKRTLRRSVVAGQFPPADVRMSETKIFWKRETVLQWLQDRIAQSK